MSFMGGRAAEQIIYVQFAGLMDAVWPGIYAAPVSSLAQVMAVDQEARARALEMIRRGAISVNVG